MTEISAYVSINKIHHECKKHYSPCDSLSIYRCGGLVMALEQVSHDLYEIIALDIIDGTHHLNDILKQELANAISDNYKFEERMNNPILTTI